MSSTISPISFERAVTDIKQKVDAATAAHQSLVQAWVQAGQIYAQGSQELLRQIAESSQTAAVEAMSGVRAYITAKSVKERIELQTEFTRASALRAVEEATRFAQAGIELAEKVASPINARTIAAAETLAAFPKI